MLTLSEFAKRQPKGPVLLQLPQHTDHRGSLGVIEATDLPFDIRRIYYLHDVPIGSMRAEHGHKCLQQVIVCLHGQVEVVLNDGAQQFSFQLTDPGTGLYLPPGLWRRLHFTVPGTVVCVLASRPYDKDDYIHDYQEFLTWTQQQPKER